MFRSTSFIISTAVQNVLIEYGCLAEILSGMSVVCEWIDWLIAVENWGWCNKVYSVHNVHTVHTVHTVHIVRTVHTLPTVNIAHTMHCAYCTFMLNVWI
jgi:hypothetical protein